MFKQTTRFRVLSFLLLFSIALAPLGTVFAHGPGEDDEHAPGDAGVFLPFTAGGNPFLDAEAAPVAPVATGAAQASKAIFFAADGMRPDLMEQYAAAGAMPTYAALMAASSAPRDIPSNS